MRVDTSYLKSEKQTVTEKPGGWDANSATSKNVIQRLPNSAFMHEGSPAQKEN